MINYAELLKDEQWKKRRLQIINKQNHCCARCKQNKTLVKHLRFSKDFKKLPILFKRENEFKEFIIDIESLRETTIETAFLIPFVFQALPGENPELINIMNDIEITGSGNILKVANQPLSDSKKVIFVYQHEALPLDIHEARNVLEKIHENRSNLKNLASDFQVHHKYYISNRLPWDYPDSALEALCRDCHRLAHEKDDISIYDSVSAMESHAPYEKLQPCGKCNGTGFLPEYEYYKSGICFSCNGKGGLNL